MTGLAQDQAADNAFLGGLRAWLRNLFGRRNGEASVREAIEELIEETDTTAAAIDSDERTLLVNILSLHEVTAADVMLPRAEIVATDVETSIDDIIDLMARDAHSRIPVFRETLDDVVGFVHIKDVLGLARGGTDTPVSALVRDIIFAAPSTRVLDLLLEMRASHVHMAIVVDEFGGVDGLITIEDLVEEIVGEIEDEHDDEGPLMSHSPDGSVLADARVRVEEYEQEFGVFASDEEREEVDTLGGVLFKLLDRVPRRAEVVTHPAGLEFEIVDADPRRVKRIRIRRGPGTEIAPDSPSGPQPDDPGPVGSDTPTG